jgi:hypothetical protein
MAFSSCFDVLVDVLVAVHLGNLPERIIKLDHRSDQNTTFICKKPAGMAFNPQRYSGISGYP